MPRNIRRTVLSQEAKTRLETLILDKEVSIQEVAEENLSRKIALVTVNDLLVNKTLVSEGLVKFRDDNKLKDFSRGFEEAQNAGFNKSLDCP